MVELYTCVDSDLGCAFIGDLMQIEEEVVYAGASNLRLSRSIGGASDAADSPTPTASAASTTSAR